MKRVTDYLVNFLLACAVCALGVAAVFVLAEMVIETYKGNLVGLLFFAGAAILALFMGDKK